MTERKFFICKHCGNLVGLLQDGHGLMACCGEPMEQLVPNTVDAAYEKHVPVAEIDGKEVRVAVGSVAHPMLVAHYIQWIYLETTLGGHRRVLTSEDKPYAVFSLVDGENPIAVYEYCNLHGLWMAKFE